MNRLKGKNHKVNHPIVKVNTAKTEDGEWDEFWFERLPLPKAEEYVGPQISFSVDIETCLVFGKYEFNGLSVRCCQKTFYGEDEESIGLIFSIGDESVESHGVLMNNDATAIPTNRLGDAIALSVKLPDDFIAWLYGFENLTW